MSTSLSPTDAELLATLERAFAHHAGPDARIDAAELQRALGLKSEWLTRRVLACFDRNGDGVIAKDEFFAGVRALLFGGERDKLEFAFRLHDEDGDGYLDRNELFRMIAISLAESDVAERASQPPSYLAAMLHEVADTNRDGRVSFAEFDAVVRRRPDLLARMTRTEAIWIAPNEELLLMLDEARVPAAGRLRRFLDNDLPQVVCLGIWAAANVLVVVWALMFGRAHLTTDPVMRIGQALGPCLDLNGALILVPMMRRLLTRVRATWLGRIVPVDDAIAFHKIVGHTLFAAAVIHAAAFVAAYATGHPSASPVRVLAGTSGVAGGVLLAVFAVMWGFALGFVRRSKRFELFYFTHLLYVAWLVSAFVHAPRFVWFAGVPLLGFAVEQALRLRRRWPACAAVSTWPLRSGVTRLEIERPPGFTFRPADYVFLRIPAVARHEWHPFTISSAPESPTLTFHIRSVGNWTGALRRLVEGRRERPGLAAFVDGPYGSPSAHLFRSRIAVIIGAGIGVTPFASVLESAVLRSGAGAMEKIYFFWLNRDQYSFEWFRGLLSRLEDSDARGVLDIHLCMTGARTGITAFSLELARDIMRASGKADLVTGLRTHTHFGPADWEAMLGEIAVRHRPARADVFFCGPHGLGKKLERVCRRLGMPFREERF